MENNQIIIYQAPDGHTNLEVKVENESVWLTQSQMQLLFGQTKQNISLHINNIFKEQELERSATVKDSLTVQKEGKRSVKRRLVYFSLDVIISVGYRVKSQHGTQFRIWANKILKDLIQGYAINERRLKEQAQQFKQLKQTVDLLGNVIKNKELTNNEATELLQVVADYSYALDILDRYDHQNLSIEGTTDQQLFTATYDEAMTVIDELKERFGGSKLFGNEKDNSFKGSIYQSFGRTDFYPTIEEKAANLLYFVVKLSIPSILDLISIYFCVSILRKIHHYL